MLKVSLIITTYNRLQLLKRAIGSAIKAGTDIEVIVVDDASSDGTENYCRKLNGIKYIRIERNQKTAGARNIGITASTAPYIGFLDDDDWRLPGSIDEQVRVLNENPECGIVYGQFLHADQEGNLTDEKPFPENCLQGDIFFDMLDEARFGLSTAVFRKECIYKVGLFDTSPDMYGIEDWDMWLRVSELFEVRAVEKPVSVYRNPETNTQQWSSDIPKQFSRVAKAYKNKWFNLPRAKSELGSDLKKRKKYLLDKTAERIIYDISQNSRGNYDKLSKIIKAVKVSPSKITKAKFYKAVIKSYFS